MEESGWVIMVNVKCGVHGVSSGTAKTEVILGDALSVEISPRSYCRELIMVGDTRLYRPQRDKPVYL